MPAIADHLWKVTGTSESPVYSRYELKKQLLDDIGEEIYGVGGRLSILSENPSNAGGGSTHVPSPLCNSVLTSASGRETVTTLCDV